MDGLLLEWNALVLASGGAETEDDITSLRDVLATPGFRFAEFLEEAQRHKVLCRLAWVLQGTDMIGSVPEPYRTKLTEALDANAQRNARLRATACQVTGWLRAADIRFAFTKGLVLDATIYQGTDTRVMGDIDLMIAPADRERVNALFRRMGFAHGRYNCTSHRIDPLERREEIKYRMYPDHLPHFLKLTSDPRIPFVAVDVANSLTWASAPWQIPTEAALETIEWMGDDAALPRMTWTYVFLFLVLHLFREGWFIEQMQRDMNVSLARFADVYLTWRRHRSDVLQGGFEAVVRDYGLEQPVTWVLAHADEVFGSNMLERTGLQAFADDDWLRSLRDLDGSWARCATDMNGRLRARNQLRLIERTGMDGTC